MGLLQQGRQTRTLSARESTNAYQILEELESDPFFLRPAYWRWKFCRDTNARETLAVGR